MLLIKTWDLYYKIHKNNHAFYIYRKIFTVSKLG